MVLVTQRFKYPINAGERLHKHFPHTKMANFILFFIYYLNFVIKLWLNFL